MPIALSDIKLLASERMRDTADGGGRMTGNVIVSGAAGNIFPKISRTDSVYGRVNLRKIFLAVRSATLDMYAGAHMIITDPPENDRIGVVLFSTGSVFDNRAAARDRIESYVVAGPLSRMRLYGNQLIGQKAVLCYQHESEPLPEAGTVIVMSVEAAGYTAAQQYVRITDVTHEVRTFSDSAGEFRRRVVTLKIGSALGQTYTGGEISRYSTDPSPTKIRTTQVADASRYYGIQPLAEAGDMGAMMLRLASVYAPLVPSTQRETPISLASISGATSIVAAASVDRAFVQAVTTGSASLPTTLSFRTARSITPGTLVLISRTNGYRFVDAGDGSFNRYDNGVLIQNHPGSIDYVSGEYKLIVWHASLTFDGTYRPGAEVSQAAHTRSIPITLATRGTVFVQTLSPLPVPGSVVVEYRALGRWYRLRDNGAGVLVANQSSEGTGSVDYTTGAVIITLGALPDVDSAVLMSWGSPAHYAVRAGTAVDADTTLNCAYTLAHVPVVPGSLIVSYLVGSVARTANDSGGAGTITGTGVTGTINYATGEVELRFATPPDRGTQLSNAYTWRDGDGLITTSTTAVVSGGAFTLPGTAPFRAGGTLRFLVSHPLGAISLPAYITSAGVVRVARGLDTTLDPVRYWADQAVGTLNTATGQVTLSAGVIIKQERWSSILVVAEGSAGANAWSSTDHTGTITAVTDIVAERDDATFDPLAVTAELVSLATSGLRFDLTATVGDSLVPGSIMFTLTGKTYIDRGGILYADVDQATGVGTQAGTVDYSAGSCMLTWWGDGVAVARSVQACLTVYGLWVATRAAFRTAGSPIRPASLYIQVTAHDGELLTATANQDGDISGAYVRGAIEQSMGVAVVEFGEMVTAAGNETEPWYDADEVVGGQIWRPREVLPDTLRYNSVVLTSLPLEAGLLGLDPVRLPSDGRVPIYRPADVVVVHHTQATALPNPVAAGQTYSVGRTDCALIRVEDANGAELTAGYVANPTAGTVTIAADWTGAGVAQPLKVVDRIEHMTLLSDVQINGQIELTDGLPRAFPLGSYVSSALLFGDLQAYVTNMFDQQAWTSVWSDSLIGSGATAQYNDIDHPIEILNESAYTERWRINFTGTTAFQVIGENLGVIATGTTATDCAPINPVTGEAYFVLRAAGWGGGWSAGNQLRFNTIGANAPAWCARTILAGASLAGDRFDLEGRGDIDLE